MTKTISVIFNVKINRINSPSSYHINKGGSTSITITYYLFIHPTMAPITDHPTVAHHQTVLLTKFQRPSRKLVTGHHVPCYRSLTHYQVKLNTKHPAKVLSIVYTIFIKETKNAPASSIINNYVYNKSVGTIFLRCFSLQICNTSEAYHIIIDKTRDYLIIITMIILISIIYIHHLLLLHLLLPRKLFTPTERKSTSKQFEK